MMSAESANQSGPETPLPFDAKSFVDSLPARPGVYRMLDAQGTILYVGKARNLKSRVGSYFQPSNVQPKVQALVAKTASMDVTITNSDTEALLLEFNLIKKHRPRFNVVLRDDKSFPYLHLETHHDFARLNFYRGSRKEAGRFFGPYPSAGAVRETLGQLQKLFRLRNCDDLYFSNRSRPCLQYQIERCTGPCVGLISKEDYARDVQSAIKVLEGRNDEAQVELARRMETAAEQLNFEEAARVRDQLKHLKVIQAQQIVNADIDHDADVIAIASATVNMPSRSCSCAAAAASAARISSRRRRSPSWPRCWRLSWPSTISSASRRRKSSSSTISRGCTCSRRRSPSE